METADTPPRIGLWGTYDVENLGDVLFPRIARAELRRRLPDAQVRSFSPFGSERPVAFDGEEQAEPLGPYRPERLAELARELDLVLVGQGEIVHGRDELWASMYGVTPDVMAGRTPSRFFIDGLGPELERACPVLWSAVGVPFDIEPEQAGRYREALGPRPYVSVRDDSSRTRLERAGVDREIEVVPPPALLLSRLLPASALEARVEQMRILGWLPDAAPALIVQGSAALAERAESLAQHVASLAERLGAEIVLVETDPAHGDARFAEAMRARLGDDARHASGALMEDVVAAIATSAGFVGDSLHGNLTAFVYGRPHAVLAWRGAPKLRDFARLAEREDALVTDLEDLAGAFAKVASIGARPDLLRALQRRVDAHFDRVAEEATVARERPRGGRHASVDETRELRRQLEAVSGGYTGLARRAAADRAVLAKHLEEVEHRRREEVDGMQQGIRDRDAEIEALRRTLADETARLEGEVAGRDAQIRALLNTRTYRYTAFLRRMWGRVRRLGRR